MNHLQPILRIIAVFPLILSSPWSAADETAPTHAPQFYWNRVVDGHRLEKQALHTHRAQYLHQETRAPAEAGGPPGVTRREIKGLFSGGRHLQTLAVTQPGGSRGTPWHSAFDGVQAQKSDGSTELSVGTSESLARPLIPDVFRLFEIAPVESLAKEVESGQLQLTQASAGQVGGLTSTDIEFLYPTGHRLVVSFAHERSFLPVRSQNFRPDGSLMQSASIDQIETVVGQNGNTFFFPTSGQRYFFDSSGKKPVSTTAIAVVPESIVINESLPDAVFSLSQMGTQKIYGADLGMDLTFEPFIDEIERLDGLAPR